MRTTIEAKHLEKLQSVVSYENKIDYLLDVAQVLETYGEEINNVEHVSSNYFNDFVEVVSRNTDGSLYDKYVNIVDNKPLDTCVEQIDSYTCKKCNVATEAPARLRPPVVEQEGRRDRRAIDAHAQQHLASQVAWLRARECLQAHER